MTGRRTFFFQEREEGLVARALIVEAERRDAHALLVDLGGIGGVGACHTAADIGVVADRGCEGQAVVPVEDRLEHEDVGQVHAAVERVVHHEHVVGMDVVGHSGATPIRWRSALSRDGPAG